MNKFAIAACLAGLSAGAMSGQQTPPTPAPPVAMPATPPAKVLTGPGGMTLYALDKDIAGSGKSTCNGPCATNWPPYRVEAGSAAHGEWSIVTRDDGSTQWAYRGKPAYYWSKDQKVGDSSGDGVNNVWHAIAP